MPSTRRWRAGGVAHRSTQAQGECIEIALKNKLKERAAKRADALAAQREIAEDAVSTTARPSTCEDSLNCCFQVFGVVVQNRTTVATTNTHTQRNNRTTASHLPALIGRDRLPPQLRNQPPVPVGAGAPRRGAERDGYR